MTREFARRDTPMMRFLLIPLVGGFLFSAGHAADDATNNIKKILTTHKSWTMYLEYTDAPAPSDRAQKFGWQYIEQGGKVVGRRVPRLAFGDCDSEVTLRPDGFSFRWCDPQLSGASPSLSYDEKDRKYPFKSEAPRKIWLQAND
jgi:hypothetical protein